MAAQSQKTPSPKSAGDDFVPKKVSKTKSWDRAVIFDPRNNSVDIRKKRDVAKDGINGRHEANKYQIGGLIETGHHRYQELRLPKGRKNVSLFVEQDDKMKLKIDEERHSNDVFLAKLNLDHLGLRNWALFSLGYLSTLYVSTDLK